MARRPSVASLDSGMYSPEYGGESPTAGQGALAAKPLRSGSGGRWLLWPMRIVLRAAILIIGYRGISAIVLNETPSSASSGNGAAPAPSPSFPVTLASAYALQFGQAYLNLSSDNAAQRARELAIFIPANVRALQPQFGWHGAGTMQLESEQVAGVDVRSAHTAVVTILATVNGSLIEIGVPLYASGHGIVVSGEPAWLPAPSAVSPPHPTAASDPAAQSALASQLPAFFRAYAGDGQATLNRLLAPGASVGGLGGAVGFVSIASVTVPPGGATRSIAVTVSWVLSGQVSRTVLQFHAIYDMSVIDRPRGRWYAREIRASTQPMGTQ
jgi:hypothetical protein